VGDGFEGGPPKFFTPSGASNHSLERRADCGSPRLAIPRASFIERCAA
jgi:hypothetical protein